jgi:ABC-type lipoprotein export system ATPase subunit
LERTDRRPIQLVEVPCVDLIASLDSSTGVVVLEALESANRELGTTTVIITHNADIQGMADRVMHVHDGLIDLLVMGTVRRTGVLGFLIDNTAERILDQPVPC